MSKPRAVLVDFEATHKRNKWIISVESEDGKELTSQEILDAVGDVFLTQGELDVVTKRSFTDFDA